eukprot:3397945-Amphidinium_carterae.1
MAALRKGRVMQGSLGCNELGLLTFGDNLGTAQIAALQLEVDFAFALALTTAAGAERLLGAQFINCRACSDCPEVALADVLSANPHVAKYPWLQWSLLARSLDDAWMPSSSSWHSSPDAQIAGLLLHDRNPEVLESALELPKGHTIPIQLSKKD